MSPHNLFAATLFAVTALAALSASPVRADVKDRLYDFTDATYRQNGIDPAKLGGRKQAGAPAALPAAVK